ncbi:MAG TPA: orotidine-5'-phosphate decarboxylase [Thiobacillaceae bacterium]|nr:orotidine-5'-phosphate decarboxylase [Thiobacillaceae bacterium]
MSKDPRIIVALDYPNGDAAWELARNLDPQRCRVKVGKELFTAAGPDLVRRLVGYGFDVFLDLKYHDIPQTVAAACKAAAGLGVWMINVHASGGRRMMDAALQSLAGMESKPLLIGVTVLTSMGAEELRECGVEASAAEQVMRLAGLAKSCNLDGVVCSAQEAAALRAAMGRAFALITPGIRPAGSETGDQTRIMTPARAIAAGADYLVIGRPITQAPDPLQALKAITLEIEGAA